MDSLEHLPRWPGVRQLKSEVRVVDRLVPLAALVLTRLLLVVPVPPLVQEKQTQPLGKLRPVSPPRRLSLWCTILVLDPPCVEVVGGLVLPRLLRRPVLRVLLVLVPAWLPLLQTLVVNVRVLLLRVSLVEEPSVAVRATAPEPIRLVQPVPLRLVLALLVTRLWPFLLQLPVALTVSLACVFVGPPYKKVTHPRRRPTIP